MGGTRDPHRPLRQISHRLVIEALTASGDRTVALANSAKFPALLQSEPGASPNEAMQALIQSIVDDDSTTLSQPAVTKVKAPATLILPRFDSGLRTHSGGLSLKSQGTFAT